jgi:hypothetical protein
MTIPIHLTTIPIDLEAKHIHFSVIQAGFKDKQVDFSAK